MHQYNKAIEKISNFDAVTKEKIKKIYISNWQQIPDHPYRILTIGSSGSEKIN